MAELPRSPTGETDYSAMVEALRPQHQREMMGLVSALSKYLLPEYLQDPFRTEWQKGTDAPLPEQGKVPTNQPASLGEQAPQIAFDLATMAPAKAAAPLIAGMARLPIRPASEDVSQAMQATFKYGVSGGNKMLPIGQVQGGLTPGQEGRVADLLAQMQGPQGYISRIIADDAGNVIEGQHRLAALRQMGAEKVPVSVVRDLARRFDAPGMEKAVSAVGGLHPDQVKGVVHNVLETIAESGSPESAMAAYELPRGFERYFEAAYKAASARQ